MTLDELYTVAASQLLKLNAEKYSSVLAEFSALFPNIDLKTPRKIQVQSVAASDMGNQLIGYVDWLAELRSLGFSRLRVEDLGPNGNLPAHIAATFANGATQCVHIYSITKCRSYVPLVQYSRETFATGPEVAALIDSQSPAGPAREALWTKVLETDINRFGDYFEATTIADARRFFNTDYERNFCPANDIVRTIQCYCAENKLSFRIPAELSNKFAKTEDDLSGQYGNSNMPYCKSQLSTEEMVSLIDAQGGGDALWLTFLKELLWLTEGLKECEGKFKEGMSGTETRDAFLSLESVANIPAGNVTGLLFQFKSDTGAKIVVPSALTEKVVFPIPPPVPHDELYRAVPNPEPWQMLLFKLVQDENTKSPPAPQADDKLSELLKIFAQNLKDAEALAKKIQSPYFEAFRLAHWVLTSKKLIWTTKDGRDAIDSAAAQDNFSERALSVLKDAETPLIYSVLQFPEEKVQLATAVGFVNVFGGMGSWNDQMPGDEADQKEYDRVSAALYQSLVRVKTALV